MEKYAHKLKQLKMRKAKEAVAAAPIQVSEEEAAVINAATKALALRWIRMARDKLENKFRTRSQTLREELEATLAQMPEEDDWYFSAAVRLEGRDLMKRGNDLEEDRKTLEAEASVKIYKINNDLAEYLEEREAEKARERKVFEAKLAQQNDRINLDMDLRDEELLKTKEAKKKEFSEIEKKAREEQGAAPTEMIQAHRQVLLSIDELMASERRNTEAYRSDEERQARIMFDRAEAIKLGDIERRKAVAHENCARIRLEVATRAKAAEAEWQQRTNRWLVVGRRKVLVKKKEDEDAKAGKKKRKGGK